MVKSNKLVNPSLFVMPFWSHAYCSNNTLFTESYLQDISANTGQPMDRDKNSQHIISKHEDEERSEDEERR